MPDTPANRAWLGKQNASNGETGYPALMLMALVETGTRALIGAVFGQADGEGAWARKLLPLLDETMLLLTDRGFDGGDFLAALAATKAQFPARINAIRSPPVLRHLPDGSFPSLIGGVKVRIITARVTVTCHDGTSYAGVYRLATTLLDDRACPAGALMALYHERWQHEIAYLALRHSSPSRPCKTSSLPRRTSPIPALTCKAISGALSWPGSAVPGGRASARARSSPRSAAGTSTPTASPAQASG